MPKDWTIINQFTVLPGSTTVDVGEFSIDEGDDTIWIEVQRIGGDNSWPWSYGISGWKTSFGYEFGTEKVYTDLAGEVHRLSVGRPPRSRTGRITYEPRSFNLAWIKKGNPLTLAISCSSGASISVPVSAPGSISLPVEGGQFIYSSETGLAQLRIN